MKNKVKEVMGSPKAIKIMKVSAFALVTVLTVLACTGVAYASGETPDFEKVVSPVVTLIKQILRPMLLLVGAGGFLYCVILGVKYATAEEPQEREKRKQAIKTAVIGYMLIFILIVMLYIATPQMTSWMDANIGATTSTKTTEAPAKN